RPAARQAGRPPERAGWPGEPQGSAGGATAGRPGGRRCREEARRRGAPRPAAGDVGGDSRPAMPNVLVTTPFDEVQIDRRRRISPRLTVTRADPETADYATTEILYGGILPRDRSRAPNLKWVQVHMAGGHVLPEPALYRG